MSSTEVSYPEVQVVVPYTETFVPFRSSLERSLIAWDRGKILIADVPVDLSPIAFSVRSKRQEITYDVRCYEGRLWWPLFHLYQQLSVENFKRSVDDPNGLFLGNLNLSPATVNSSRSSWKDALDADLAMQLSPRRHSGTETSWELASELASRLIFCGGFVYQMGGDAAYFGVRSIDETGSESLSLSVGTLQVGSKRIGDRWHLGAPAARRRSAARKALVFDLEDVESAYSLAARENLALSFEDFADFDRPISRSTHGAQFCADAIARAVACPAVSASSHVRASVAAWRSLPSADYLIPVSTAQGVIGAGFGTSSNPLLDFGVGAEAVSATVMQLDRVSGPSLCPVDEEALFLYA